MLKRPTKLIIFLSLIMCGTSQIKTEFNFLQTTVNHLTTEAGKFAQQIIIAYIVHYIGQSCTNTLYTWTPSLVDSNAQPFISLAQTATAYSITNEICDDIFDYHYHYFGHLIGWACATSTPKPAEIVSYLLKKYVTNTKQKLTETLE